MNTALRPLVLVAVVTVAAALSSGCSHDPVSSGTDTALLSVTPPGGTLEVDVANPIVVEFDHPLREGMEAYLEVREGSTPGRALGGYWESSNGRTRFTFRGSEQFQHRMAYEIHVGGGLVDHRGHHVDLEEHGFAFGGEWCTEAKDGPGMMGHPQGPGWMHPNGHYGMRFRFWTAP